MLRLLMQDSDRVQSVGPPKPKGQAKPTNAKAKGLPAAEVVLTALPVTDTHIEDDKTAAAEKESVPPTAVPVGHLDTNPLTHATTAAASTSPAAQSSIVAPVDKKGPEANNGKEGNGQE